MKLTVDVYADRSTGQIVYVDKLDYRWHSTTGYELLGTREIEIQPIKEKVKKWRWVYKRRVDSGIYDTSSDFYVDENDFTSKYPDLVPVQPIEETMIEVEE